MDDPAYCPLTTQLNANQRDALISFAFNCGAGCLKTLCKGRTLPQICDAMALYDKSGGKPLAGLIRRRKAEQTLFNTPAPGGEEKDMNIENLTDEQLIRLAERMQAALAKRPVSAALQAEVNEAMAAGITDGSSPGKFCTRAQAAAMVIRSLRK